MPFIPVDGLDHPELEVYCNLKHTNRTRWSGQFIAEGEKLTLRLLQSDFQVHSVLVAANQVPTIEPYLRADTKAFVIPTDLAAQLVGFNFHSGMMGCGLRRPSPKLEDVVPETGTARIVVCPKTENPDNLGSIVRLCTGFGVHALLLGFGSVDPYMRRTLRVSMGSCLTLPIIESGHDLAAHLNWLKVERGVELCATILDPSASLLKSVPPLERCGLLLGNEQHGLAPEWIAQCQRRLTIPMADGTDSLNVAFAAGIFMYHFFG